MSGFSGLEREYTLAQMHDEATPVRTWQRSHRSLSNSQKTWTSLAPIAMSIVRYTKNYLWLQKDQITIAWPQHWVLYERRIRIVHIH